MFSRISHFVLFACLMAASANLASAGVRMGTFTVGFGYFNGPAFGPFCCYDGFYGPFWGRFCPYYPAGYFAPAATKGTVKLIHANKDAAVYIDNAYAGRVSELKSINIEPGAYDLELQPPGDRPIQKRIYVLSGKTLKVEF